MKNIIVLSALVLAGATMAQAAPDKKKKKEQQTETCCAVETVAINTPSDSLSYASGMALTNGLLPFLKQQYGVDEAFMDDFVRGFQEALAQNVDEPIKAYGAGIAIAGMVKDRMLPGVTGEYEGTAYQISPDLLQKGFMAALKGDTTHFTMNSAEALSKARRDEVKKLKEAEARKAGEDFLAENATKEGVTVTPSGLQYKVLRQGTGAVPTASDEVVVKYEGRLIDGTVFDSSYERNPQTSKFRANQVIKGWTEALTMMPVGSKWELYIPENLAYGERAAGKIPPFSALIFTVELEDITKANAESEAKPAKPAVVKPAKATKK